jgi:hypothetical protein
MNGIRAPRPHILTALALAAAVLAIPAAPASAKARCAPKKAKTIKSTSKVRVYRKGSGKYACWTRTGRTTRIDDYPREPDFGDGGGTTEVIGHIVVSGAYVAYSDDVTVYPTGVEEEGGQETQYESTVEVLNVKHGEVIAEEGPDGGAPGSQYLQPSDFSVVRIVLRPSSAMAWTARSSTTAVVAAMDPRGTRVLDDGAGIDAGSLKLAGRQLRWIKDGTKRTGTL